ncbi:hypothetical protein OE09_1954 [Flavobacteriaceae bacterium MAR_2010_72]|nr:hypothetical protein OE09_1954 [Flavobacteriaceae bacterium MAR_2010_72]TVZ59335.1 hypothetical protein NA63_1863 [Flavobacteriaceae bacterium MAR_2010_105]
MVLNSIEKLLEKYDNGETSLKEEQQLRAYFASNNVAPHLESYRVMFQYFNNTKQEQFTKDVPLKSKTYRLYKWISVAAVALLMLSVFTQFAGPTQEEEREALLAYNQTMEALSLVSSKFNQGATSLNALNMAGAQFEKGVTQVGYISEFSTATDKIFKNK